MNESDIDIRLQIEYNIDMPYYDEIVKHLMDRFPHAFAALALNTTDVEVGEKLSTEQPTIKVHHSDMTFKVRLPDEEAILHIEAQTDDSREKLEGIMRESPFYDLVIQRGVQQGVERGARETTIESILLFLDTRFQANTTQTLKPTLEAIDDLQRLKQLLRDTTQAQTLDAFIANLKTNGNTT